MLQHEHLIANGLRLVGATVLLLTLCSSSCCSLPAGDHGSTFAGNPLVCQTACTVFDIINTPSFLASVTEKGEKIKEGERGTRVHRVC